VAEAEDPTRRTRLAGERTELAWWRTGLTALAVALGVGRVIPALDNELVEWPYVVLGAAFAVYGIALICFGSVRARRVDRAVGEGGFAEHSPGASAALAAAGALLGLATAVLIVVS
jgi:putative membrane protein